MATGTIYDAVGNFPSVQDFQLQRQQIAQNALQAQLLQNQISQLPIQNQLLQYQVAGAGINNQMAQRKVDFATAFSNALQNAQQSPAQAALATGASAQRWEMPNVWTRWPSRAKLEQLRD